MRRFLRRSLLALSVVLCVATVALWLRSCWITDFVFIRMSARTYELMTPRGRLMIEWLTVRPENPPTGRRWNFMSGRSDRLAAGNWRFWTQSEPHGVECLLQWGHRSLGTNGNGGTGMAIMFPFWLLTCLTAAWPTATAAKRIRALRRTPAGTCSTCGYDLRATPERCP